jgi:hypothetical protein
MADLTTTYLGLKLKKWREEGSFQEDRRRRSLAEA